MYYYDDENTGNMYYNGKNNGVLCDKTISWEIEKYIFLIILFIFSLNIYVKNVDKNIRDSRYESLL